MEFEGVIQRIESLENRIEGLSTCSHLEVWNGRVNALKSLFKMKFLDYVKRPLGKSCTEHSKLYYSDVLKERLVRITVDCDYELFSMLHRSLKRDFWPASASSQESSLQFLPKVFNKITPPFYNSRITVVFKRFNDLQAWMGITDELDKSLLLFRSSTRPSYTAASVFGSLQLCTENRNKPVNVFVGQSATREPKDEEGSEMTESQTEQVHSLYLGTGQWDDRTMSFTEQWSMRKDNCPHYNLDEDGLNNINYFGLVWEPRSISTRSGWSAETMFNGGLILGSLSLNLPTVEFYNATAVHIMNQLSNYVHDNSQA